jgi:hypothetical protein
MQLVEAACYTFMHVRALANPADLADLKAARSGRDQGGFNLQADHRV